ncbi:MAG: glycosyltransferase [Nitrososphaeria archaeon]
MIRICFVSSYPPSRGRLSEYAYNLISELEKIPVISRIDIITEKHGDLAIEKLSEKTKKWGIWKSDNFISLLFIPFKIITLKPDIVHFNVHMAVFGRSRISNFVGLCLPFLCRLMGLKTVVTMHNLVDKIDVEKTGFKNTLINRLGAFLVTKLISLASAVTFTMKSHAEFFKKRYGGKNVKTIPHGTWKIAKNGSPLDPSWVPGRILYLGHSGPYKNLKLLFDAYKKLKLKKPESTLIIGGASHPNYPGFLESHRSSSMQDVQFIGYIPEDQLQSIFEKANIVVLPYLTCTGTSGVAHLASSFGTPIVATDLPEFRELSREGCGLLLAPHSAEAFADRIEEVLGNPNLALKLRYQNLHFASYRTWDVIASKFCKLYLELLGGKKV